MIYHCWYFVLEIDLKSPGYVFQVKLIQSQGTTTMSFTSIACIQYDMIWLDMKITKIIKQRPLELLLAMGFDISTDFQKIRV